MCPGPEKEKAHREARTRDEWDRQTNQVGKEGGKSIWAGVRVRVSREERGRGTTLLVGRDSPDRASAGLPRSTLPRAKPSFGTGIVLIPEQKPGSRNSMFPLLWEISTAHNLFSFLNSLEKILSLSFFSNISTKKYFFFQQIWRDIIKTDTMSYESFSFYPTSFPSQWETFSSSTSTQSQAQTRILNRLHRPDTGWQQPWFFFWENSI